MEKYIHFTQYSPAADIVVMAVCIVMIILVYFSYFSRTRSSKLFVVIVGLLLAAACLDVSFYTLAVIPERQIAANWLRCAFHTVLLLILVYYIAYICEVTHYEKERLFLLAANLVFAVIVLIEFAITARGLTFVVDRSGISFVRRGVFIYGYLGYMILCVILLSRVRKLLFHRIVLGFSGTIAVSFLILVIQGLSNQASFTVASLMLPTISMLYVLHSNPYDALLGTNDVKAMQDYVQDCSERNQEFILMSLYLKEFEEKGKEMPKELQDSIRQFTYDCARKSRLFKIGKGHMILMFLKKQYPDYEQKIGEILKAFTPVYEKYLFAYKIVVGESIEEISRKNEYVNYIRSIHKTMSECAIHRFGAEDVVAFNQIEYIAGELTDIFHRRELDDPRVLVYCQPVLNVRTERYDTAEALMRLELPKTGIVYPDQFIGLAEDQGYIHILTQIILHKTCEAIRSFLTAGYELRRISVNVAVSELKNENFCEDITGIIQRSGIPAEKIAIELTESQNEGDFILMKQRIGELKEKGIQFYLDDFGTGYSNMERILELPFDIIKFDRSLVLASDAEERSRKMVSNLAHMFSDMDYDVLYEGVEKETDEVMCRSMSATYLQGYRYSRPVPVSELERYLGKAADNSTNVVKT